MTGCVEFWSSTEIAGFQRALVKELVSAGCPAKERFVVRKSEYWKARSALQRLTMRTRAYVIYPLRLRRNFRHALPNTIGVVCSNTFYAPSVAIRAARRGTPVVHWVFDLFPDVLISSGWLKKDGWGERVLHGVVWRTFQNAAANVFLGHNIRRHAEARFGFIPRAEVIEVGADGGPFRDAEPGSVLDLARGERPTALYCGNLGRMHDIDTLSLALNRGPRLPIEFRCHGNGPAFPELERRIGTLANVSFGANLEDEAWVPTMKKASVALVFLKEEAADIVIPSKTYSALVAGQAVLAICPAASDLAQLIRRHDAGWIVTPGDVDGLIGVLQEIAKFPEEVLRKRRNAWRAGHAHYEQRVIAQRWLGLLGSIAKGTAN